MNKCEMYHIRAQQVANYAQTIREPRERHGTTTTDSFGHKLGFLFCDKQTSAYLLTGPQRPQTSNMHTCFSRQKNILHTPLTTTLTSRHQLSLSCCNKHVGFPCNEHQLFPGTMTKKHERLSCVYGITHQLCFLATKHQLNARGTNEYI